MLVARVEKKHFFFAPLPTGTKNDLNWEVLACVYLQFLISRVRIL